MNTIPLAAVERIEVLSDSGSAIYGADAVGGVVNVILKNDISRPVVDVYVGAASGGAEERRVSVTAGHSTGRFRALAMLDYWDRGFLMGPERQIYADQDYRRYGSIDRRSANTHPGNVSSTTTASLPGLPSRFAAVPQGSSGVGLVPQDFLPTAGQRNLDSLNRWQSIVPESLRRSAATSIEFDMAENATLFGELLYSDKSSVQRISPAAFSGTVPARNPFNPFGVPVSVSYLFTEVGPRELTFETEDYRAVAGVRGRWRSWESELSLVRTESDGSDWTENGVNAARVAAAVNSANRDQALNLFRDGPAGSEALLTSLLDSPLREYSSRATQVTGVMRGELVELPAGALEVAVGGEWWKEHMQNTSGNFAADRRVSAGFVELRVPLISGSQQVPAIHALSVTVAGRHDDYSDFGDITNPQVGLVWRPVADVMVQASYGTNFRPPSLQELYGARSVSATTVADPHRNNETAIIDRIIGGNPDLDSTEGDSGTLSIVLTPKLLAGLSVSTSYWRIKLDRRVSALPFQLILANEDLFPGRVRRAEPLPADVAAGMPGRLVSMDTSRINFGRLETSGVDVRVTHSFTGWYGSLSPSLSATWIESYESADLPGQPPVDRVGIANFAGTIPEWRAVASLGWNWKGLGVTVVARHTPAYDDADSITGAATGRSISPQTLMDVQGSVEMERLLPSPWSRGLKASFGVSNLLDRGPSFAEFGTTRGYDFYQGDIRQRFGYLQLSKSF